MSVLGDCPGGRRLRDDQLHEKIDEISEIVRAMLDKETALGLAYERECTVTTKRRTRSAGAAELPGLIDAPTKAKPKRSRIAVRKPVTPPPDRPAQTPPPPPPPESAEAVAPPTTPTWPRLHVDDIAPPGSVYYPPGGAEGLKKALDHTLAEVHAELEAEAHTADHGEHARYAGKCQGHEQNSIAWLVAREMCFATASICGALCDVGIGGLGGGLAWVQYKRCPKYANDPKFAGNAATEQGHYMEPVTNAMYTEYMRRATDCQTFTTYDGSFWTVKVRAIAGPIGASPDGMADLPPGTVDSEESPIVQEYKAPVHVLYTSEPELRGVKLEHLVQVHVQMGATGARIADYVAVCYKTRRATAARVYFSAPFYTWIMTCLRCVQAWMRLPMNLLEGLYHKDPQNYQTKPPTETVCVRALHEVYPHMPPFEQMLWSDERCKAFAEEAHRRERERGVKDYAAAAAAVPVTDAAL